MVAKAPVSTYADIVVLTVTLFILGNVFRLGADRIFVGEVHAAEHQNGVGAATARGGSILAFALLSGLLAGLLVWLPPLSTILDRALSAPLTAYETLLVGVWLVSDVTRLVASEGHRSRYKFALATISGMGARAPLFLFLVLVLQFSGLGLQRTTLLLAAAVSSLIVSVVAFSTVGRLFPWWHGRPWRTARPLWRGHMAMVATTLAAGLIGGADVWIVGATMGDSSVARYAFAVTMVAGIGILSAAISSGLSPYLAAGLNNQDLEPMRRMMVAQVRGSSLLAVIAYVGLLVLAEPLATLLGGDAYKGVLPLVALLGAGQLIGVLAGPSGGVITVARMYRLAAMITVSVAMAALVLEAIAGFWGHSEVLIALASGAATGGYHVVNNIALSRRLSMTTHVFNRIGARRP
jgi:O-antigen/teichoic acid export membrane protein